MAKGINLEMTEDFVCTIDKDDPKTIWKISAIDSIALSAALVGSGQTAEEMMNLVRFGLKGTVNFMNNKGSEVMFETEKVAIRGEVYEVVSRRVLKQIPLPYILEVGTRILAISSLSGEQGKN